MHSITIQTKPIRYSWKKLVEKVGSLCEKVHSPSKIRIIVENIYDLMERRCKPL